jgi:hypothetical protein
MTRWLAATAALWLFGSSSAEAQMKSLGAVEVAELAKNRTLDLRIALPQQGYSSGPHLSPGMLVRRELGTNAAVGLGLANMYQKRRGGSDQQVRARKKPAVTFTLRF